MPQAARLGDSIGHSPTMNWLIQGAIAGAILVAGTMLVLGTGGVGAVAVAALVGGAVAGGAGIGEALSTMSFAPKEVCGKIIPPCSSNVFINGRPAARAHVDMARCAKHPQVPLPISSGSATVFINGLHAARVSDTIQCSAVITDGSANVFIGGGSFQTDVNTPENLVPPAVHTGLLVLGVGSALLLVGPVVALSGIALGMGGGMLGGLIGGMIFGEGSDGQKWSALGLGAVGGMAGGKLGFWGINKVMPSPNTSATGFINGGWRGMRAAQSVFRKRTEESAAAADVVLKAMKSAGISPDKSPVVQVLTHKNGTVSVGISGDLKLAKTQARIDLLQKHLDETHKGIFTVSKITLSKANKLINVKNSNALGTCAEPKAAAIAAQNPSKVTGGETIWRGSKANGHPYKGPGKDKSKNQMAPCKTCSKFNNHMVYHETAITGKKR